MLLEISPLIISPLIAASPPIVYNSLWLTLPPVRSTNNLTPLLVVPLILLWLISPLKQAETRSMPSLQSLTLLSLTMKSVAFPKDSCAVEGYHFSSCG
jgi:hypothetical protein